MTLPHAPDPAHLQAAARLADRFAGLPWFVGVGCEVQNVITKDDPLGKIPVSVVYLHVRDRRDVARDLPYSVGVFPVLMRVAPAEGVPVVAAASVASTVPARRLFGRVG